MSLASDALLSLDFDTSRTLMLRLCKPRVSIEMMLLQTFYDRPRPCHFRYLLMPKEDISRLFDGGMQLRMDCIGQGAALLTIVLADR